MKPAIRDLTPGCWAEPSDVIVSDRSWPATYYGPHTESIMTTTPQRPLVQDQTGRIGHVMGETFSHLGAVLWLRPPEGGLEWEVPASSVTPVETVPKSSREDQ